MSELQRDIRPILLRFGVALALSYAGFFYSRIRARRIKSLLPPPSSPKASGCDNGNQNTFSATIPRVTISSITQESEEMHRCRIIIGNSLSAPKSPSSSSTETPQSEVETPRSSITAMEKDTYEEEIRQLKNMVRSLQDRERNLEARLVEYYDLKDQESATTELLQNRLKLKNIESKLLSLKIESLRTENKRLEKQAVEHAKVVSGLEIARSKIRVLKNKLRSEAEQNREQILQLQKRVEKLQIVDRDSVSDVNPMKLKDLEHNVEELKESNARLRTENADLAQRLESTQILANSMLEDPETEALKRETEHLRRENESLTREVEQLQANRCSDVEELVYLRWINACLRYELRNYEPPSGRTAARDLSKTLSPKSEAVAKRLILEYAAISEIAADKVDVDLLDELPSSHFSCLTDSGELDDYSSFSNSHSSGKTHGSTKKKNLFGKLRKLILRKDVHEENPNPSPNYKPELVRDVSSSDSSTGRSSTLGPCLGSARHSLDIHRLRRLRLENDNDSEQNRRTRDLGWADRKSGLVQTDDHLVKYAKALRDSWGSIKSKPYKKSASVGSFQTLR